MLIITVSVGQEFGSGFAGWFLFRVSPEVAVSRAPRSDSHVVPSQGWQVGAGRWLEASVCHYMDPFMGLFECPTLQLASPPEPWKSHSVNSTVSCWLHRPVLRGLWIHLRACEQRGGPGRVGPRPLLGFCAPSVTCHCGPDLSQSLAHVTLLVGCAVCHCHGLITVLADQVAPGWLPPELPADTPLTCPVIRAQGNYFASHFFMGGEKFDTPHPEGYLFGENMDLNFLGNRPVQFPYVTPAPHEPVKTLRSLVNIRKDSLRLVRYKDGADSPTEDGEKPRVLYSLEFTFDADARVAITIYCQAVEEFLNGTAAYTPKSPALQSETVHYKRGVSQQFSLPSFKIDFSEWKDDEPGYLDCGSRSVQALAGLGDRGQTEQRQLEAPYGLWYGCQGHGAAAWQGASPPSGSVAKDSDLRDVEGAPCSSVCNSTLETIYMSVTELEVETVPPSQVATGVREVGVQGAYLARLSIVSPAASGAGAPVTPPQTSVCYSTRQLVLRQHSAYLCSHVPTKPRALESLPHVVLLGQLPPRLPLPEHTQLQWPVLTACSLGHLLATFALGSGPDAQLNFDLDRGMFPVVIQAVVDEGDAGSRNSGRRRLSLLAGLGAEGLGRRALRLLLLVLSPRPGGRAWLSRRWCPPCSGTMKAVGATLTPRCLPPPACPAGLSLPLLQAAGSQARVQTPCPAQARPQAPQLLPVLSETAAEPTVGSRQWLLWGRVRCGSEGAAGRGGRGKDKTSVGPQRTRPCLQAESWGRASWKEEARGGGPGVVEAGSDHSPLSRAVVEVTGHAHVLLAAFEKHVDGSFSVKPLKQKQIATMATVEVAGDTTTVGPGLQESGRADQQGCGSQEEYLAHKLWSIRGLTLVTLVGLVTGGSKVVFLWGWARSAPLPGGGARQNRQPRLPPGPEPGTWEGLSGKVGAEEPLSWEQVPRHLSALQVDRVSYLLQEIYGIENKNNQETKQVNGQPWQMRVFPHFLFGSGEEETQVLLIWGGVLGWGGVLLFGDLPLPLGLPFATAAPRGSGDRKAPGLWPREPPTLGPSVSPQPSDEENSDNSNECVVCLSDLRDTLILPCRHLCLCNSCADTLRYQASNCPICRLRCVHAANPSPVPGIRPSPSLSSQPPPALAGEQTSLSGCCGKRGPLFIAVRGPLTVAASPVAEHRLQTRRLSNCGSRAQSLCGMWDLPRPGLEPIRAVRKKPGALSPISFSPVLAQSMDHDEHSDSAWLLVGLVWWEPVGQEALEVWPGGGCPGSALRVVPVQDPDYLASTPACQPSGPLAHLPGPDGQL
ncbi:hypothetical protein J1605_006097 [Eschrichtius robustus]|uniref:E3 ubiquitin-protein ligase n=2 Tax=Amniota TaxID=32524 RepID=A0AB34H470_ESCRO|nr:hypothetical protein J1605_006097 [Eschrichtius robustus]